MELPAGLLVRGGRYYSLYKQDGKWVRKAVGGDLSVAIQRHSELRGGVSVAPEENSLGALFAPYLKRLQTYGTERTFLQTRWTCGYWEKLLQDVSQASIQAAVARMSKTLAPATVNTRIRVLVAALNLAVEEGRLPSAPKIKLLRAPKQKTCKPLSPDEVKKLLASAEGWVRGYLLLAYSTGMRASELLWLKWEDLDFQTGEVLCRPKEGWTPKSGTGRTLWVSPAVLAELVQYRTASPFVFGSSKLTARKLCPVLREVRKAYEKAGLYQEKMGTSHRLRRSFATFLMSQGVSLLVIKDTLGHADLKTSLIYLHGCAAENKKVATVMADVLKQ